MDTSDARNAWTPQMAFWNTVGTVLGAITSMAALLIALVALMRS